MNRFNRRSLLKASLLGAGAVLTGRSATAADAGQRRAAAPDRYVVDDTSAVAETESGKVVGYLHNDVRVFKGIPYGEVRGVEGRWRRASRVTPWTGKRSSRGAGPVCPQYENRSSSRPDELNFRDANRTVTAQDEDCLRLNVWTPGIDGRKRQVLFYLHGGGYRSGSSLMETFYDGRNLAEYGDVVVVSINHRLNCLGFLDLTAYSERWADTANLGMLDAVDALKWVQRNIAGFGGDPGRIMIFGHSGGGSKVSTLLCMPAAKGLFHKAVVHSPGPMPLATPEMAAARTETFFRMLDVTPGNVDALFKLPMDALMSVAQDINNIGNAARERFDKAGTLEDNAWRPVVDGRSVIHDPTQPTVASDVPLIVGTVLHEGFSALGRPELDLIDEAEARDLTRGFFGPAGDEIYDVYKGIFPAASPFRISAAARAMGRMRGFCVKMAQKRAALGSAPSYNYWFQWQSPNFGGLGMSHHTLEMPLVFQNSDEAPEFTGAGDDARELGMKMTDAWLAFARSGDPNTAALPAWQPATSTKANAVVFDTACRPDPESDAAAIELFWKSRNYA